MLTNPDILNVHEDSDKIESEEEDVIIANKQIKESKPTKELKLDSNAKEVILNVVITEQPKKSLENSASKSSPKPIGEFLDNINYINIKEKVSEETVNPDSCCAGWFKFRPEKKFIISGKNDVEGTVNLFEGVEKSNFYCRNPFLCCDCECCGFQVNWEDHRSFSINLFEAIEDNNKTRSVVISLTRPWRCNNYCLCCLQVISVNDTDGPMGNVNQKMGVTGSKLVVADHLGVVKYEIVTPTKKISFFTKCMIPIFLTQMTIHGIDHLGITDAESSTEVGSIGKDYIKFPEDASTKMKAVLIGAAILVNYNNYFKNG